MVGGQPQGIAFSGMQPHEFLAACLEETGIARRMLGSVYACSKGTANKIAYQARALRRVHPGICRHARIRGVDRLAVVEVVACVDAIDEHDARLGVVVGRAHDALPQCARREGAVDLAAELQLPRTVGAHGGEEIVGDQHRQIEVAQPAGFRLGFDEGFDVGVVAAQRRHHGAAPAARRHDGAAHGVPHLHEADRAGGVGADRNDARTFGAQRREVVPDPAALLHGQRGILHALEDGAQVVVDLAEHEAVEQGDVAACAGAGEDAAGRQEAEIGDGGVEALGPLLARLLAALLDGRCSARHAPDGVVQRRIDGAAVRALQAVFQIPDFPGNRGEEFGLVTHRRVLLLGPPIWVRTRRKSIFCSRYILFMFLQIEPASARKNRVSPKAAMVPRSRSAQLCRRRIEWPRLTIDRM